MQKAEKKKVFITTAIDYTNDVIHIGHAYQKILADCVARFYRLRVGTENVLFLTGTDEHGQKIYHQAKNQEQPIKEFVDEIAKADQIQQDALNISYDRFIRTTDE
ncbi:class I tRNA ligase family protein, partial [Patescibacteria group bacterium]|nr:class I tRNA ligase family protein [Patescibacteria group bacterium]